MNRERRGMSSCEISRQPKIQEWLDFDRLAELDSSCHLLLVSLLILTRPLDICLGASVLARPLGFMHLAAQPLARLLGLNCFGGCWYV